MIIHGFTFVRNAIKYDYPVVESIQSILPIVDEFIVNVGESEDATLDLIAAIDSPKIKIVQSVWDDSIKEGGRVLAVETDKAFAQVSGDADWAFYLQADEVVHEQYLETIKKEADNYLKDKSVEGLLFKYRHFYGSYDYEGNSHRWYDREIRMIRNDKSITSYRDAQGFRKAGRKLNVKLIDAYINHYGWVKHPQIQQLKRTDFETLWNNESIGLNSQMENDFFNYMNDADSLSVFNDSHPAVMTERINAKNWKINFDTTKKNLPLKDKLLNKIEKLTGKRLFAYRNYKII